MSLSAQVIARVCGSRFPGFPADDGSVGILTLLGSMGWTMEHAEVLVPGAGACHCPVSTRTTSSACAKMSSRPSLFISALRMPCTLSGNVDVACGSPIGKALPTTRVTERDKPTTYIVVSPPRD